HELCPGRGTRTMLMKPKIVPGSASSPAPFRPAPAAVPCATLTHWPDPSHPLCVTVLAARDPRFGRVKIICLHAGYLRFRFPDSADVPAVPFTELRLQGSFFRPRASSHPHLRR